MTVSSDTARWAYNGDASTTTFSYNTKIFADSDLDVYVDGTLKTLTTHYTVTGAGSASGGNVVFTAGNIPASGTGNVIIVKDVPYTQASSLPLGGEFPSTTVESMVDKAVILIQQLKSKVTRTLRQPDSDASDIAALPAKSSRAGNFLSFDSSGDPVATTSLSGSGITLPVSVANGGTASATAAAALNILAAMDGTPDTDLTANGPTTNTFAAAGSITALNLVYLNSSSQWAQTDADAAATAGGVKLAISLETKTVGQAMKVALPGSFVRDDSWNWTPGATLYVSETAGAISASVPTGVDGVVRVIGYAVTADVIFFLPSDSYVVIDASGTIKNVNGILPASGKLIQMVSVIDGAVATGTTTVPYDDTIPQNTEGNQFMSLAITPTSATNNLIIIVSAMFAKSTSGIRTIMALFQDTTADALAVSTGQPFQDDTLCQAVLAHTMVAGTISATTFKARIGGASAGTITFNGVTGARQYGGKLGSSIIIMEVAP